MCACTHMAHGSESESVKWRREGNRLFQNYDGSFNNANILNEVLNCYRRALDRAQTHEEMASANKNCAKICWKQLQHHEPTSYTRVMKHYQTTLDYFNEAFNEGCHAGMAMNWLDDIRQSMQACWDQASDYMSKYSDSLPTRTVNELQMSIKGALERIKTHVEAQASPVSQHGCTTRPYSSRPGQERNVAGTITLLLGRIEGHLNDERFVEAMSNLKAVGRLLRNVQSNNSSYDGSEITKLTKKYQDLLAYTNAIKQFREGLDLSTGGDPDMVLEAMDCYRRAMEYASETSMAVHIKAEAYGCLGSIYEEVRNYPERAIEYYQKALESEVVGRMPDDWASDTSQSIDRCTKKLMDQKLSVQSGSTNQSSDIASLKEKADKLVAEDNQPELIMYIWRHFPPTISKFNLPTLDEMAAMTPQMFKLQLLKMFRCYHPDKNRSGSSTWRLACEEICTILNTILM